METGTAYWAHIGGFAFGAVMGVSLKFFGIEKKYIEPMVEDSFEKLKVSASMKDANRLLDDGNTAAAIPFLHQAMQEEPHNCDAALILARLHFEQGNHDDALTMYNRALELALRKKNDEIITAIYEEVDEKRWIKGLSERNLYTLAGFYEGIGKYDLAVKLYGVYIHVYHQGAVRPKAIYRTHKLFKEKLQDDNMARNALAFLHREYPDWIPR
jgi:tetratricopeptide (TPR) repeat protein